MRPFSYTLRETNASVVLERTVVGGLPLRVGAPDLDAISHVLPLGVRWDRLLVNVCTLSLPVVGLQVFFLILRPTLRQRRGECAGCRYPAAEVGSVCPECGRVFRVKSAKRTQSGSVT